MPILKTPPNFSTTNTNPKQTQPKVEQSFDFAISNETQKFHQTLPMLNVKYFIIELAFFSDAFGMYGRMKSS